MTVVLLELGNPPHDERRSEARTELRRDVAALQLALLKAREDRDYETAGLRAAVVAMAVTARRCGLPPERLLSSLQRAAQDPSLDYLSRWWRNILTDRFVRWGLDAYYGETPSGC
jgi:hypothetical protein